MGEALVGPRRRPAGPAHRRQGPDRGHGVPAGRDHRPGHRRAPAGQGAAADRHQGHRLHDPHRPRPARAHHRRPPDRQDRHRHRHHHQPEGPERASASTSPSARRHPPCAGRAERCEEYGAMDYTIVVAATASTRRRCSTSPPTPACAMGEYFRVQRPPRPVHLRRPLQAGRRLPPDVAAPAPPAGPRSLPRRRVLPALPPAGARRQAQRRARRRLAHGASRSSRRRPATSRPTSRPT